MDKESLHFLPDQLGVEFKTLQAMVHIYCRSHHHSAHNVIPCRECIGFLSYANEKLDRCPYGQHKPTCQRCQIHCYNKQQRQQAKEIMRYAGPRMLVRHPILAIKHLLAEKRPVPAIISTKASNRYIRKTQKRLD